MSYILELEARIFSNNSILRDHQHVHYTMGETFVAIALENDQIEKSASNFGWHAPLLTPKAAIANRKLVKGLNGRSEIVFVKIVEHFGKARQSQIYIANQFLDDVLRSRIRLQTVIAPLKGMKKPCKNGKSFLFILKVVQKNRCDPNVTLVVE